MKALFADTFYYLALFDPNDSFHQRAVEVTRELESNIITTAWILLELANSLSAASHRKVFATSSISCERTQALQYSKPIESCSILALSCIVAETIRTGL